MPDPLDPLLAAVPQLQVVAGWLPSRIASGIAVHVKEPPAHGETAFVVLDGRLDPDRPSLAGTWSTAVLALQVWSVHDSLLAAAALGDQVRAAVLNRLRSDAPLAGVSIVDVAPAGHADADVIAGVAQQIDAFSVALSRA